MSPEQARGEELDRRSDLFSLGAVLYEMATGRLAFGGGTTAVVFEAILNRTPLAASRVNPELIPDLGWIAAKLLEKDRKLRYQSAAELQADLKRVKRDTESSGVPTFTPRKGSRGQLDQAAIIASAVVVLLLLVAVSASASLARSLAGRRKSHSRHRRSSLRKCGRGPQYRVSRRRCDRRNYQQPFPRARIAGDGPQHGLQLQGARRQRPESRQGTQRGRGAHGQSDAARRYSNHPDRSGECCRRH